MTIKSVPSAVKSLVAEKRYEHKIAKSQKKIGQYVPKPYCKTIYA